MIKLENQDLSAVRVLTRQGVLLTGSRPAGRHDNSQVVTLTVVCRLCEMG